MLHKTVLNRLYVKEDIKNKNFTPNIDNDAELVVSDQPSWKTFMAIPEVEQEDIHDFLDETNPILDLMFDKAGITMLSLLLQAGSSVVKENFNQVEFLKKNVLRQNFEFLKYNTFRIFTTQN